MSTNGTLLKTIAGKFKRLRFFHGMLLTETDFQEEQTYYRDKLKLHNRLHGDGVVWGLCLKEPAECPDNFCPQVIIEPGVALDCAGNEIVVCRDYMVSLETKIDELKRLGVIKDNGCNGQSNGEAIKLYIGLRYCECESKPVQQYTTACDGGELHPEFSRVSEGFCVEILTEDELPDCCEHFSKTWQAKNCTQPDHYCPGLRQCCEDEQIVILGSVEIREPNIYEITADQINMADRRKFVYTPPAIGYWPFKGWEDAKNTLIYKIAVEQNDWKDISQVIGKKLETAIQMLKEMGFSEEDIETTTELTIPLMKKVLASIPFAPTEDSTIHLVITDNYPEEREQDECVLFAYGEESPGSS